MEEGTHTYNQDTYLPIYKFINIIRRRLYILIPGVAGVYLTLPEGVARGACQIYARCPGYNEYILLRDKIQTIWNRGRGNIRSSLVVRGLIFSRNNI